MTNKELDLTENATDATINEETISTAVENSTENVASKTIEETAKDNMNEPKDTIENATENSVEETANTVKNTTIEASDATIETASDNVAEAESVTSEIPETEQNTIVESIAVAHSERIISLIEISAAQANLAIEPIEEVSIEVTSQDIDYRAMIYSAQRLLLLLLLSLLL